MRVETIWVEKPSPQDNMPVHVLCRVIMEINLPMKRKGTVERVSFLLHAVLSDKFNPPVLVYPKTLTASGKMSRFFDPNDTLGSYLEECVRRVYQAALDSDRGHINPGIRYKKSRSNKKIVKESQPGV